jgi:hypothetical protein
MAIVYNDHLEPLQEAFKRGNLTFYLGAGVSKASGLPSWEELVQALYFTTLQEEWYMNILRPFPNYLFALAEWVLKQKNEPLDIIIRKIKDFYPEDAFLKRLRETLYAGLGLGQNGMSKGELLDKIKRDNKTFIFALLKTNTSRKHCVQLIMILLLLVPARQVL